MATSRKVLRDELRTQYTAQLMELLSNVGEDTLQTKTNEFCFPVVDKEGNEDFVVISIKIPTGAGYGNEIYDGYAEAASYEIQKKEKAEKAKKQAELKAKKIAADARRREQQAAIKAKAAERKVELKSKSSLMVEKEN